MRKAFFVVSTLLAIGCGGNDDPRTPCQRGCDNMQACVDRGLFYATYRSQVCGEETPDHTCSDAAVRKAECLASTPCEELLGKWSECMSR